MTVANSYAARKTQLKCLFFNNKTDMTSYLSYAKIGTDISLTA